MVVVTGVGSRVDGVHEGDGFTVFDLAVDLGLLWVE